MKRIVAEYGYKIEPVYVIEYDTGDITAEGETRWNTLRSVIQPSITREFTSKRAAKEIAKSWSQKNKKRTRVVRIK